MFFVQFSYSGFKLLIEIRVIVIRLFVVLQIVINIPDFGPNLVLSGKDMGTSELNNFLIDMTTEWYKRDALILDLRYNRGGNVHDAVLNFLSQKAYSYWKYRGGKYGPQPNFAPSSKPIVLLLNQQSLSDAEMTGAGFRELKLGKIVGTETYRWLIFTSRKSLVDGSFYRLPSWGCYTLGKEDIETTGVKPDIYIKNTLKDKISGNDPQLDKAIEIILKQLKK